MIKIVAVALVALANLSGEIVFEKLVGKGANESLVASDPVDMAVYASLIPIEVRSITGGNDEAEKRIRPIWSAMIGRPCGYFLPSFCFALAGEGDVPRLSRQFFPALSEEFGNERMVHPKFFAGHNFAMYSDVVGGAAPEVNRVVSPIKAKPVAVIREIAIEFAINNYPWPSFGFCDFICLQSGPSSLNGSLIRLVGGVEREQQNASGNHSEKGHEPLGDGVFHLDQRPHPYPPFWFFFAFMGCISAVIFGAGYALYKLIKCIAVDDDYQGRGDPDN